MKLRRLEISNYRCFADAAIDFPVGPAALVGRNGAGKSTLLEAVVFALFGVNEARTGKEGIRSDFAAADAPCRAELTGAGRRSLASL